MNYFASFLGIGTTELILIVAIILLIFGAKKLPELAKSIGTSAKELKKGLRDEPEEKPKKSGGGSSKSSS